MTRIIRRHSLSRTSRYINEKRLVQWTGRFDLSCYAFSFSGRVSMAARTIAMMVMPIMMNMAAL